MRLLALCRYVFLAAITLQAAVAIAAPAHKGHPKAAKAATTASAPAEPAPRPFGSGADPNADPNQSLKSCMDHAGINPMERDRCMRQHCAGRWGQGDCPAGADNFLLNKNAASRTPSHTPLGQCLAEAGKNPLKRNACGWKFCRSDWNTPECSQFNGSKSQHPN